MSREFNSEEQAALDSGKVDQAVHDEARQAKRYRFFRAAIMAEGVEKDALDEMMVENDEPDTAEELDALVDEAMDSINFEG